MPSALNMYTNDLLFYVTLCLVVFRIYRDTYWNRIWWKKDDFFLSFSLYCVGGKEEYYIEIEINTKSRPIEFFCSQNIHSISATGSPTSYFGFIPTNRSELMVEIWRRVVHFIYSSVIEEIHLNPSNDASKSVSFSNLINSHFFFTWLLLVLLWKHECECGS